MVADVGAWFQLVLGAAIRAFCFAMFEVQEYARVRRPQRHGWIRAVGRQVVAIEFYWLGGVAHFITLREIKNHDFNASRQRKAFIGRMSAFPCACQ